MILLGRGENSLFEIGSELDRQLRGHPPGHRSSPMFATISGWRCWPAGCEPDLILHAAAHKHVPMMEDNPEEAVQVNVAGTANLIAFRRDGGRRGFVMISTDKAVQPTSIMGATKKLAEMVVREAAAGGSGPRFMVVRFGNVLGSRGSVVPFFQSGSPPVCLCPSPTRT